MLAMKVFPYSLLQWKASFCQTYAKEKRCNLKKITTLLKAYLAFVFDFCNFFRCCGNNPYALIAQTVKQRVELPPLRRFFRCFIREKELVYGYVITGYKLIKDLQAWLLPFVFNIRKVARRNIHFVAYFLAAFIPARPSFFYRLPESCKVI